MVRCSVFLSYRVASEGPLARLLFDELNHSVTPAGHRVTVYWDAHRLVKGENWEEGFATGLLNSLCIFPLLSYGATAPLASLPSDESSRAQVLAAGWEERPVGRERLRGDETDAEDNVLKEILIASTLLERQVSPCGISQVIYSLKCFLHF
jgi:YD repeat-containing protein